MVPFAMIFPEIGHDETRTLIVKPPGIGGLPADDYGMIEMYCVEADCDCRRVTIQVLSRSRQQVEATINHAFDPPGTSPKLNLGLDLPQTFLDPINPQGKFAEKLFDLFLDTVLTPEYEARLRRHYAMVKRAIADPSHPVHEWLAEIDARPRPTRRGNPADLLVPRKKRKWR